MCNTASIYMCMYLINRSIGRYYIKWKKVEFNNLIKKKKLNLTIKKPILENNKFQYEIQNTIVFVLHMVYFNI